MTFPTIEQVTYTENTSNVTTHNVDLPATIAVNDLIVILGSWDSTAVPTDMTKDDVTEGTWTELYNQHVLPTPSQAGGCCWVKKADGTEGGATLQPTTNEAQKSEWYTFLIPASEWYGTIATGIADAQESGSNQTTPDPPNLAPGWGAEDILWIAVCHSDTASSGVPQVSSWPETSNQNQSNAAIGSGLVAFCTRENAVASYNPGSFTLDTTDQSYGATIAIRPAAAAAGTNTTIIVPTGPPLS